MSNYSKKIMTIFNRTISELVRDKDELNILRSTGIDFSRKRKLTLDNLMKIIIFMSAKPIKEELFDYFNYDRNTATSSAFVQARDKLLPNAFKELFIQLNKAFPCQLKLNGYHLIAVDGTELAIPLDINDMQTFKPNADGIKGTCLNHINAAYDILNHRYVDMIINGHQSKGEQISLYTMAERYTQGKAIFIADRNYATWNVMEHINRAQQAFLIRCKDIHSTNSLLRKFNIAEEEFDIDLETTLTNVQTNEVKMNPDKYRVISTTTNFDYISSKERFYPVKFRAVRFKIDGKEEYESILTNLPREEFPPEMIKELYSMRWGIEVSYRHLKYATGLKALHAKKRNNILQEIWARAILYNLSMILINKIATKHRKKVHKWNYTINITRAIHMIRDGAKRKGGIPPQLEEIMAKEIVPIRPGRSSPRKIRPQSLIGLNYRFS